MQGLWKNNLSGYDKKGSKRKKQSKKDFFKDKIEGIYKNSLILEIEGGKYSKREKFIVDDSTYQDFKYQLKYVQFKREIRLTDDFITKNCDYCPFNSYFSYLRNKDYNENYPYLKTCYLDEYSTYVKSPNNKNSSKENYKKSFENHNNSKCLNNKTVKTKFEYKIFKVIDMDGIYYKENKKGVYKNKISSYWNFDKIIKESNIYKYFYSIDRERINGWNFIINDISKQFNLDYKSYKKINRCYGYCCHTEYYNTNEIVRKKDKMVIKKMIRDNDFDYEFHNRNKKYNDYC